jgi:hypothetical protein
MFFVATKKNLLIATIREIQNGKGLYLCEKVADIDLNILSEILKDTIKLTLRTISSSNRYNLK